MRWRGRRRSGNVEDRRGISTRGMVGGGIGTLIVVVVALVMGVDPTAILSGGGDPARVGGGPAQQGEMGAPEDSLGQFVATVLASTEDTWNAIFRASGSDYPEPTLVLFTDAVRSACGVASSAVGPFYCPRDGQVYIDLGFYRQLRQRFGAGGDAAEAYVIAHEVGHHVQNLQGAMNDFAGYAESGPGSGAVRLELQADCYAGIWAHHGAASGYFEPGDLEEALRAAAAIGDDNIQRRTQGAVVPESFTHGTSEQRMRWFQRGYETGDPRTCDTSAERVL